MSACVLELVSYLVVSISKVKAYGIGEVDVDLVHQSIGLAVLAEAPLSLGCFLGFVE